MKEQINKVYQEQIERKYYAQYARNYWLYSVMGGCIIILAAWKAGELILLFWEWIN